jgi:predicted secreted protein
LKGFGTAPRQISHAEEIIFPSGRDDLALFVYIQTLGDETSPLLISYYLLWNKTIIKSLFRRNKGEFAMSKKLLKTVICLVLFVSLYACSTFSPAQETIPTPNPAAGGTRPALTDPAQPIEVQAGETFHIVIDSNPSTGYHWEIVGELSGVEFVSRDYTTDEPVAPGSGVDVWTFNAVSAGQTQITFGSYPPGVDSGETEQTVTFDITVE